LRSNWEEIGLLVEEPNENDKEQSQQSAAGNFDEAGNMLL